MQTELKSKMDGLARHMRELTDELRLDPSPEAVFCSRLVSQSRATMDMRINEMWGKKLDASPLPIPPTPEPVATKPDKKGKA